MINNITVAEHFWLKKTQAELDFINIYIEKDIPLFLDPWAIRQWGDDFSLLCHSIISSFFEELLNKIRKNDKSWALYMLTWLHEPSETHLWLSKNSISWSWIWVDKANEIFNKLKDSEAVQTWFLNDLEDTALMIEWIKEDNISDIVTNLIRFQLIKYTQEQCNIHWINMRNNTPTWYYWNSKSLEWESSKEDILIINWKKVILVPKLFARKTLAINFSDYYNFEVLDFEQALHLDAWTSLCKTLKSWKKIAPSKKALKDYHPNNKKQFIYEFSKKHPKVLSDYKKKRSELYTSLSNETIVEDFDLRKRVDELIWELKLISTWKKDAYKYENLIVSILEIILYPDLYKPTIQERISDWLKIIDISYENTANHWFFSDITKAKIACRKIYFECKNYSWDLKNPEFDQLNWRFSDKVSEIWFLVCRKVYNKIDFMTRTKYFVGQKHFIIWLEDEDLVLLLNYKADWKSNEIYKFLNQKLNYLISI